MKRVVLVGILLLVLPSLIGTVAVVRSLGRGPASDATARPTIESRKAHQASLAATAGTETPRAAALPPAASETTAPPASAVDPAVIAAEDAELAEFGTEGTQAAVIDSLGWYPSLAWKVETYTYEMEKPDHADWSEKPVVWQFTVKGTETVAGRLAWRVAVEPVNANELPYNPGGAVYVAVDDHSVVALRDRVQENGQIRERYIEFEDAEGSALSSLLPVDLPPRGIEGCVRKSAIGALPRDPFRPDPKTEVPRTSGTVVDVEFEVEGSMVRQRWDKAMPYWPLYSRTPSRVSFLRN